MDNGMSLFQGTEINISKCEENEDEEDFEEQQRRNQELQNLVKAQLDDFNFDESTINSSTNISIVSTDEVQNKYCDTTNLNEQMKILYDVRVREINNLRQEFENYKKEKFKELDDLRNKTFMYEAEFQQMKISLKTSEELLVEKDSCISELKNTLNKQNEIIKSHEKTIQNLQIDINSYISNITELQLKLEKENTPFYRGAERFKSEELQKVHQEQIARLETLLEDKTKSARIMEKEKHSLQQQIDKFINSENEDKTIIKVLTENFESAQKQCQELIGIIEKLTQENSHLKGRINEKCISNTIDETHDSCNQNNNTTVEKLRKMILDKTVENNVLEGKLRDYGNSLKELIEYRTLKSEVYKEEFQQCDNKQHSKKLLIMQNELQNYEKLMEHKNQQIISLNSTNKELLEKLEQMLCQTRSDIQNISHKYNLPQLEKMTEDLQKSQEKIAQLEMELNKCNEIRQSLSAQLQKTNISPNKELELRYNDILQQTEKDRINFENELTKYKRELEAVSKENSSLKSYIDQLIDEIAKLKQDAKNSKLIIVNDIETSESSIKKQECVKAQCLETKQKCQETECTIKHLEDIIQDLTNGKTLAEGEQCTLRYEINDHKSKLEAQNQIIKDMETDIEYYINSLKEKDEIINKVKASSTQREFKELESKYLLNEEILKSLENTKNQLLEQVEKLQNQVIQSREEIMRLTKQLATEMEKNVRRNLEKELDDTQNAVEEHLQDRNKETDCDVLRLEFKLREEIQKDYLEKLKEIEKKYETSCNFSKDIYKEQAEKFKAQENKYREQLSVVLTQCAQKIKDLEDNRSDLLKKNSLLRESFENYRQHVIASENAFKKIIRNSGITLQDHNDQWRNWFTKFVSKCIKIENISKDKLENIYHKIDDFDRNVTELEKLYNSQVKKYVKTCKM